METITDFLSKEIPNGNYCNPDNSPFPKWGINSKDCPYHKVGIYCDLHEEMVGNDKICGINQE